MAVSQSYNDFAFNLYRQISSEHKNVFISPYSIVSALSMCYAGAKNKTEVQLKQLLNYSNLSNDQVHSGNGELIEKIRQLSGPVAINVANKVYPRQGYPVKQQFTDAVQKFYRSEVQPLDFSNAKAATKTINDWVEAQTNSKIKDLVSENLITDATQMILVNAIYFKGSWLHKFDKAQTTKEKFTLRDGTVREVDMMRLLNKKFKLQYSSPDIKASICEFPYAGENISMTIVLPHDNNIEVVEKQLNPTVLRNFFEGPIMKGKVHAFIPKFKFEESIELSEHLKVHAPEPFDMNKADFSGINESKDGLHISKVVHKAVVEVNEEGTEAAAATAVVMMTRCAMIELPPEEFRCDRPFIFIIHDNQTHTILFMGKYMKPE